MPEELSERGAARDTHHAQHDIDELFQVRRVAHRVAATPVVVFYRSDDLTLMTDLILGKQSYLRHHKCCYSNANEFVELL